MKTLLLVAAASVCTSLSATTFVLKAPPSTLDDWKNGEFYEGGVAPTGVATDTIATKKENNLVIELDTSTENGKKIVDFLNPIRGILASNAVLKVTVPSGEVSKLTFAIWDNGTRTCTLEKYGDGELFLAARLKVSAASTSVSDYETHHHVFAGTVRLTDEAESVHKFHQYHSVTIEKQAKVITLFNDCVWQMRGLYGEGMITNEAASACALYMCEGPYKDDDGGDFKGTIGGKVSVHLRSCDFTLSGMSSTFTEGIAMDNAYNRGCMLSLTDFGEKSRAGSSLGKGTAVIGLSSSPLVYLGFGQTTDRDFQLNYVNSILDAGTNGNLVYKGILRRWDATKRNPSLFLSGDNREPCTFAARGLGTGDALDEFSRTVDGQTEKFNYYFGKRGTGEWYFPLTGYFQNTGVFAVENGILSFESIDRAGELTALGYSTRLFENKEITHPSAEPQLPYAFLLGSDRAGETGLMECTTNLARQCTDRPFGLKGRGGFLANRGLVKYANVFGVGTGEKTLVLDGTDTQGSEVHDVADHLAGSADTAVVSVEKNGSGTWILGGDQTFSGSLTVNDGMLIVRRPAQKYQRYRLIIMETANKNAAYPGYGPSDTGVELHLSEIGLYASNGKRQNLNLKYNPAYAALQPGQCALGVNRSIKSLTSGPYNVYELLFDGYRKRFNDAAESAATWHAISSNHFLDESRSKKLISPIYGQPTTYLPFDMYLADTAEPIDHFDLMITSANNYTLPSRFQLQASVDGLHWDEVSDVETISKIPTSYPWWLSTMSGGGYTDGGHPDDVITSQTRTDGWKTTKTAPTKVFSLLENVGAVTVANGATLKYEGAADGAPALSQVKLAAGATGSIDGFAFAEEGTFEINAMDAGSVSVGVTLPNATGLGNVANWQVKVGGVLKPKYSVKATADGFTVDKGGLAVIFR